MLYHLLALALRSWTRIDQFGSTFAGHGNSPWVCPHCRDLRILHSQKPSEESTSKGQDIESIFQIFYRYLESRDVYVSIYIIYTYYYVYKISQLCILVLWLHPFHISSKAACSLGTLSATPSHTSGFPNWGFIPSDTSSFRVRLLVLLDRMFLMFMYEILAFVAQNKDE